MRMLRELWNDEDGILVSTEYLWLGTLVTLGLIVGIKSVRDSLVTELADYAQAICNLNSDYTSRVMTRPASEEGSFVP
jgi:Flp pilus assembly pilin Flp